MSWSTVCTPLHPTRASIVQRKYCLNATQGCSAKLQFRSRNSIRRNGVDPEASQHESREPPVEPRFAKQAAELLAKLLTADDAREVAKQHVVDLTEDFFTVATMFLEMARSEGTEDVVKQVERVLMIAMEEKNATLRSEIQLLNELLMTGSHDQRAVVLQRPSARATLTMNDGYFFKLIDRMSQDSALANNESLCDLLRDIRDQAAAAAAADGAAVR